MKLCVFLICAFTSLWSPNSTAADPAPEVPPIPATIGKTAEQLWRSSKFAELEKYLTVVAKKYPKRVVSHVAIAFVEEILHRDVHATAVSLKPIMDALDANQITAPDEFTRHVGTSLFVNSGFDDPEFAARNEQLKRNPEVAKTRAFYGAKVPELLQAITLSPNVDLP